MKELSFLVGSAIQIDAILSINTAQSCTCSIKDEGSTAKVTDASMTKIADRVYQYIYQSSINDLDGDYTAIVKIVSTLGTSYEKINFTLELQP